MDPNLQRYLKAIGRPPNTGDTVAERNNVPFGFDPGTSWSYGAGIDWAGLAVERVTGTDLETYFKRHIFAPLGVGPSEATFWPFKAGLQDRMANYSKDDPRGAGLAASTGVDVHQGTNACVGGQGVLATGPAFMAKPPAQRRQPGLGDNWGDDDPATALGKEHWRIGCCRKQQHRSSMVWQWCGQGGSDGLGLWRHLDG